MIYLSKPHRGTYRVFGRNDNYSNSPTRIFETSIVWKHMIVVDRRLNCTLPHYVASDNGSLPFFYDGWVFTIEKEQWCKSDKFLQFADYGALLDYVRNKELRLDSIGDKFPYSFCIELCGQPNGWLEFKEDNTFVHVGLL